MDPRRSFTLAQLERIDAFRSGDYNLDEDEGMWCTECDWHGLSAPMADDMKDEDELLECPECGSCGLESGEHSVRFYQRFGYEYTEFPEDIPDDEEEKYRR